MNKEKAKQCLKVVEEALRQWDPIGVIDLIIEDGLPPNEYDAYAPSVFSMLERGKNAKEITSHLVQIRKSLMGLGSDRPSEHETKIGEKLASWRNNEYKNKPDFRRTNNAF